MKQWERERKIERARQTDRQTDEQRVGKKELENNFITEANKVIWLPWSPGSPLLPEKKDWKRTLLKHRSCTYLCTFCYSFTGIICRDCQHSTLYKVLYAFSHSHWPCIQTVVLLVHCNFNCSFCIKKDEIYTLQSFYHRSEILNLKICMIYLL